MRALFFVTFGQFHEHTLDGKLFNHDVVGILEARSSEEAFRLIHDYFGEQYSRWYGLTDFDFQSQMPHYPRGFLSINF